MMTGRENAVGVLGCIRVGLFVVALVLVVALCCITLPAQPDSPSKAKASEPADQQYYSIYLYLAGVQHLLR
jgi:hypothetical protein